MDHVRLQASVSMAPWSFNWLPTVHQMQGFFLLQWSSFAKVQTNVFILQKDMILWCIPSAMWKLALWKVFNDWLKTKTVCLALNGSLIPLGLTCSWNFHHTQEDPQKLLRSGLTQKPKMTCKRWNQFLQALSDSGVWRVTLCHTQDICHMKKFLSLAETFLEAEWSATQNMTSWHLLKVEQNLVLLSRLSSIKWELLLINQNLMVCNGTSAHSMEYNHNLFAPLFIAWDNTFWSDAIIVPLSFSPQPPSTSTTSFCMASSCVHSVFGWSVVVGGD